jgi:phosphatidylglycerol:prolipoprotein diacylglycerol transferase
MLDTKRFMYPYIHIGSLQLGTFGILLWLAAVAGIIVLQRNFTRYNVDGDALNIVAMVVIFGVIGAKTWHELQNIPELVAALHAIGRPGWAHPWEVTLSFLRWFQAGFAWFGGLLAGIAMLLWQGRSVRFRGPLTGTLGARIGGIRLLDLAAPATAIGYGVGRIGCLTSGDGDYGRNTTSTFWGVHLKPDALVPPHPLNALVLPTPLWELGGAIVIAVILWHLGSRFRPVGWLTGMYLVLSGIARFIVEFWRVNPKLYAGMSNAQVAAIGSVIAGGMIVAAASFRHVRWSPELPNGSSLPEPTPAPTSAATAA